jgi:hypothetical protein
VDHLASFVSRPRPITMTMTTSDCRHHKNEDYLSTYDSPRPHLMSRVLSRTFQLRSHLSQSSPTTYIRTRNPAMVRKLILPICCVIACTLLLKHLQDKKDNNILNWAGKDGSFKRQQSVFRNWIENKPDAQFPPEKDRYHLYVSYACPWAHRALIVRSLKGLEDIIPVTSVHYEMLEKGLSCSGCRNLCSC